MRKLFCLSTLSAVAVAALPGAGQAAPPILESVKFDNATKVLSVSWTLPPGVETSVLEANTNTALDSEGYFLYGPHDGAYGANTIFEVPDSAVTSWLHRYPDLPPGQYYVHVGGFDGNCGNCPVREWTSLGTFTVAKPPPRIYAPDCSGRPHFKPGSIVVACGDGNLSLLRLSWHVWTSQAAAGLGIYHWNDCIPACYRGHFHSRAGARVKLYRVTRCRSKGFLQFTRMTVTPPSSLRRFKPFTEKLSCNYR
jgi:hypothetical protein